MTVAQDILRSGPYNTDGVTKVFAATFQYLEDSDIVVTLLNTTTGVSVVGVINQDYTVVDNVPPIIGGNITIANNGFGGVASATGIILAGYTITLNPALPLTQLESYPNAGLFPSAAVEQALDRLTLICQGLQLATTQSLKYPVTDPSTITSTLPNNVQRANLFLAFDALGNPIAASTAGGGVTISGAMIPVVQAATTMAATKILLNATIASLAAAYVDTNVLEQMTANVNSYAQEIIQNTSNGATASADLVVSNNSSTATTFYGNFGMNSSGFTGAGAFNKASAVYLTSTSGDLAIGTTTANTIHFVYNNSTTDAAFIDGTGLNAVTQAVGTNTTQVATMAAIAAVTGSIAPTFQTFTSGSGTYTKPANVKWIRVRMVGGGGGAAGSGNSLGTTPGAGGNTTFGTSLWTAGGGQFSVTNGATGGAGGTFTVSGTAFGIGGGYGGASTYTGSAINGAGSGGNSVFGGGGSGGGGSTPVPSGGVANTGGGGGGGAGGGTFNGPGGGAGAYVEGIIGNPAATYSYAIGAGGTAGGAGSSGQAGTAGGSGVLIVEEHYSF